MLIVADENIPLLDSFFAEIGEIRRFPGRTMTAADVRDADVLLVRSVTKVNSALLDGSRVRFVGSATIGFDHVDLPWLDQQDIEFACAPGCNANSVVEYVLSALSIVAEHRGVDWTSLSVGIVGYGNVGRRLAQRLDRLGFDWKANDPLLEASGQPDLVSLDEVLRCDVISLHTPLATHGEWPTHHLINADRTAQFGSNQVLINTSRGEVVDTQALQRRLAQGDDFLAVLDVWEGEPQPDPALVQHCFLATPHIAGYSLDGKVAGTEAVYQALCRSFGLPVRKKAGQMMTEPPLSRLTFTSQAEVDWAIHTALRACFDVRHDDAALRRTMPMEAPARAAAFDALRKGYRARREFHTVKVRLKNAEAEMHQQFRALGFTLDAG